MSKKITDAPKNLKHTSMRLLQLLFQQKSRFGLILISALCYATLMTIAPLLLGQGLDNLITLLQQGGWQPSEFLQVIKWPLLLLGISWLMISLFSFLQEYTMASVSETLTLTLRKELTHKFNRLPVRFYDTHQTGDILSRAILDLDKVSEVLQVGLMQLITATLSILFGLGVMFWLSPLLTVGIIIILLISAFATHRLAQRN